MAGMTPRALATALGILSKNDFNLSKSRDRATGLYIWKIGVNLFDKMRAGELSTKFDSTPKLQPFMVENIDENMRGQPSSGDVSDGVPSMQGAKGD